MNQATTVSRYENLSLLRVIAVAGVFIGHLAQRMGLGGHLRSVTDLGSLCVELFIMLSGFFAIRYFDTVQTPRRVLRYYLKRMFRLLPLYYLVIGYFFLTETFLFRDVPADPTGLGWSRYIFLLAGNIRSGDSYFDFWTNLGSTWTIFVFATFYALMPLIARLVRNYRSAVLFLAASWILRVLLEHFHCPYLHTFTYLIFFAAGFLLWYGEKESKHAVTLSLIGLALMFHLAFSRTILAFNDLIMAMIAFMLLVIATFPLRLRDPLMKKAISLIERYSYTIYLGQGIIFCGIVDKFAADWSKPVIFFVSVFGTGVLCFIIHHLYEKPLSRLGDRLIARITDHK